MMKEKKKQDSSLAETPEARQSSSVKRERQVSNQDNGSDNGMEFGRMDLRELIARRAYEIYEERGRYDGEDMNDWLKAEAEVKSSIMAKEVTAKGAAPATSRVRARQ